MLHAAAGLQLFADKLTAGSSFTLALKLEPFSQWHLLPQKCGVL